jgi:phosphotriesterase-related protein
MAQINTVLGPVDEGELGIVLPHERVLDDWTGAPDGRASSAYREVVRQWVMREFTDLVSHGARTVIEVTPIGCGRDAALLRQVQEATNLRIVASTGLGPAGRRPAWAADRKPKHLTEFFVKELTEGLDGTDSCAGLISLAAAGAREEDRKVLKAVGAAHKETGAPIIAAAPAQRAQHLDELEKEGVPAHCVALAHADVAATLDELQALAGRGAFLIFADWGIAERVKDGDSVALVKGLMAAGFSDRLMLSVDFGFRVRGPEAVEWPMFGVPGRTYAYLFRAVLPMLRGAGLTDGDLWQMMVANPAAFLAHGGHDEKECRFCAHHH